LVVAVISFSLFVLNSLILYNYANYLPQATQDALRQIDLTTASYFWISIVGSSIMYLPFFTVGLLIYWRRSDERIAILSILVLLGFSVGLLPTVLLYSLRYLTPDDALNRLAIVGVYLMSPFAWPLLPSFLLSFPDGRFVPGWTRYVAVFGFVTGIVWSAFPQEFANPQGLLVVITFITPILLFGSGLYAQVYRYRRVSTPAQRQQTKWFVMGLGVVGVFTCFMMPLYSVPELLHPQPGITTLVYEALTMLWNISFMSIPLAVGFAILRYRLWDVDLVINRSLVYGVVTLILAAVFAAGVVILRAVLGQEQSGIALAVSLVAAGGLFNPARKQVRHFVDRRLYRLRFDLNELAQAQKLPEVKNAGALTGKKLGCYQVLDVVGKGGMGEVYKGFDGTKTVALKILPDDLAKQEEYRARFQREAEMMRALQHPNIVRLFDAAESDGLRYLALEYVDGLDLGDYLRERGPLPADETCALLCDLAAALDYAHRQGLVHRDIKPSNIMLRLKPDGETNEAVLMDFGIAKIQDARTRYTGSGAIGTVDYMAPEQIMAAKEVDHRADIYALGVVVYEMLTGQRPFQGSAGQVLFAHLQQPVPDPREINPNVSRAAAKATLQALAKQPEERFQSAGEFVAALT
jgi:predicted Ser/Thr protein kinase